MVYVHDVPVDSWPVRFKLTATYTFLDVVIAGRKSCTRLLSLKPVLTPSEVATRRSGIRPPPLRLGRGVYVSRSSRPQRTTGEGRYAQHLRCERAALGTSSVGRGATHRQETPPVVREIHVRSVRAVQVVCDSRCQRM